MPQGYKYTKFNQGCTYHLSSEPGPAATMVGNIVMGTRIGGAAGREIADIEEDSDMARKVRQIQYNIPLKACLYGEKI